MTVLMVLLMIALLLFVSLQRTYSHYPLKELKRRAREGDEIATALAKAVGYGHSLRTVLWTLILGVSAVLFLLLSNSAPLWFALASIAILIYLGFIWLPAARVSAVSERLAAYAAPGLEQVVSRLHPVIDWVVRYIQKRRPVTVHTGLYDKQDLIDLLARQQVMPGSRIEKVELDIAASALTFGDKTVGETMIPRRAVKMVSVDDALGPITLDELYASGHSRFPVYETKQDNIVGTLFLHDLVRSKGSSVKALMHKKAYYLHEDQSLHDALQALLQTHHHLFVVVNSFEEFVGIISSEDVLEEIVGKPIMDEFDKYEDMRAVAARAAKKEHLSHKSLAEESSTDETAISSQEEE